MRFLLGVGLIGCGALGRAIAKLVDAGRAGDTKILAVFDRNREKAYKLAEELSEKPKVVESVDDLLKMPEVDVVVEAASQEAVKQYARKVVDSGKNLVVLSVGALLDAELLKQLVELAKKRGKKVLIPSGAVAGVDGISSASIGEVKEILLVTHKSPKSLGEEAEEVEEPKVLFEGDALEAVKRFPRGLNVAATISLAGIGAEKTRVRVVLDPSVERTVHEIFVKGEFGELYIKASNVPTPENPRSSYLAALSVASLLKRLSQEVVVGA